MTEQQPDDERPAPDDALPDNGPPDNGLPDKGPEGDPAEEGLLHGLPRGVRWLPLLLFVVAVVGFETLAPNVYGGEDGALGTRGFIGGLAVLVVALVVLVALTRRRRD